MPVQMKKSLNSVWPQKAGKLHMRRKDKCVLFFMGAGLSVVLWKSACTILPLFLHSFSQSFSMKGSASQDDFKCRVS